MFRKRISRSKSKSFPFEQGSFLKGNADSFKRGWRYVYELSLKLGLYFKIRIYIVTFYFVLDPKSIEYILTINHSNYPKGFAYTTIRDLVGKGLFSSDPPLWKRDRTLLQPLFKTVNKKFVSIVQEATLKVINNIKKEWQGNPIEIDSHHFFFKLTFEVIQKAFIPPNSVYNDDEQMYEDLGLLVGYIPKRLEFPYLIIPRWIPIPYYRKILKAKKRIDKVLYQTISDMRRNPGKDSFMDLMGHIPEFTDKNIRDHIITFIFAGHETSALTLQYFYHVLMQYPEYANKVKEELDGLGGKIAATLNEIPFTKAMVYEVLRLYTAFVTISRQNKKADYLGDYYLPAKSLIQIPIYSIHRNPLLWDAPDEFNPYRFFNVDEKQFRYKWIPFGDGPRVCIGQQMALSEIAVVISTLHTYLKITPGKSELDFIEASISLRSRTKNTFFCEYLPETATST